MKITRSKKSLIKRLVRSPLFQHKVVDSKRGKGSYNRSKFKKQVDF